jgi:hypothetical protein
MVGVMDSQDEPITCSLSAKGSVDQAVEWVDIQHRATRVAALPSGARMVFPLELATSIDELVSREATCCGFLDFVTTVVDGEYVVDVTSSNPDALPLIKLLSGVSSLNVEVP